MKYNWLQKIYLRNVEKGVIVAKEMGTFGYGGVLGQFQQPAEFYKIRDNNGRIHKTLLDRATRNAKGGVPLDIGDKVTAFIYRFAGVGEKHLLDTKFIKWYEKVV